MTATEGTLVSDPHSVGGPSAGPSADAPKARAAAERRAAARLWLRWAAAVLAAVVTVVALAPNVRLYRTAQSTGSVVAQLRYLRGALRAGAGEDMQELFPEGYFFSHVLYGLAWVEVALADGDSDAGSAADTGSDRRREALREARWALRRLDGRRGRAPFAADLRPAHGVFYVGWSSWLRAKVVELAGPEAPEARRLTADGDELAQALSDDGPFLESYPVRPGRSTPWWPWRPCACTTGCWSRASAAWWGGGSTTPPAGSTRARGCCPTGPPHGWRGRVARPRP